MPRRIGPMTSVHANVAAPKRRRRHLLLWCGPAVLSAMALVGSTVSPASTLVVRRPSTTVPVREIHCNFVDSSRSVPDYATSPPSVLAKVRALPTTVWLPPEGSSEHPRPLVLFAAGYDSYPGIYAPLLMAWAEAGFVVAAPTFPDENPAAIAAERANTEGDLANEPADIAYVGRALERASARRGVSCPAVSGMIEPHVLVVGGHSDGAIAAALFAFGTGSDPHGTPASALRSGFLLHGAMIFSGAADGLGPFGAPDPRLPLLMIQSAGDHCNPERDAVALYRTLTVDERFFLLLRSAQHRTPFDGTDKAAFTLVSATSIRFLRLAARGAHLGAGFVAYGDRNPLAGSVDVDPPITPTLQPNCGPG